MSSSPLSPKSPVPSLKRKTPASSNGPTSAAPSAEKKSRGLLFNSEEDSSLYREPSLFRQSVVPAPGHSAAAAAGHSSAAAAGAERFTGTFQPPLNTRVVEDIGDSDREGYPEKTEREHYRYKVLQDIKPQALTITQKDGTKIKGAQLLLKVHQIIQTRIRDNQDTAYTVEEIENTEVPVKVESGKSWLKSAGYWALTGASCEIKKEKIFKKIEVGPSSLKVRVEIKEIKYVDKTDPENPVDKVKQTERLYFNDPVFFKEIFDKNGAFKCLFEGSNKAQNELIKNKEFCKLISEFFPTPPDIFTIDLLWDKNFKIKFFKKFETDAIFKDKILDIYFNYTDFSCQEISMIMSTIFPSPSHSYYHGSVMAALSQLSRLTSKVDHTPTYRGAWLDYVNAWMFGVESSRVNATFATGLMTLELIKFKKTSYYEAFVNEISSKYLDKKNVVKANGKDKSVGGEFPLATLYSGTDNFKARREFLERAEKGEFGTKELRRYPQWHGVPLKEIITIINWLHLKKVIDPELSNKDQLVKIEKAVNGLIDNYFSK